MTIRVKIYHKESRTELASIDIENMSEDTAEEFPNYSIRFGTSRGFLGLGLHQRVIYAFPRLKYNVLGLLRQALSTLEEEELSLESCPPDLAWRQLRAGPEVQAGED